MQPDVALNPEYEELYPFSKIVGKANILIMPGQHSAAISYKMMKTLRGLPRLVIQAQLTKVQ